MDVKLRYDQKSIQRIQLIEKQNQKRIKPESHIHTIVHTCLTTWLPKKQIGF